MSITVADYQLIQVVSESKNTVIYRGIKKAQKASVIIKTLTSEFPILEEIARVKHEYKILELLKGKGIVEPVLLVKHNNGLALILADCGGESLKNFMGKNVIQLSHFLKIAIQLASTLDHLHKTLIIHKDIKPHNILINPNNYQIKIIDFSISSCLSKEKQILGNPIALEGTLAYMSPEQTGRMNRSIDYRTDFYSLGVTFYEMLTGSVPFTTTDPLELIHCHIAKKPVPPSQVNSQIPLAVSDIVMKLLAKTAEERYQSALGLKADLEACLHQLETTGKIENFIPGQLDLCSQFLLPQKLYGRDKEVKTLLNAFDRVSLGATEMMLVSGYSGIGKSSLVNEVHKPIVRQRGYFIAGKFDQFKRNIPYASLIQAFQELMRQLLTESQEKIAFWKEQLLDALGQQGRIIIDVIPEVELIIGSQPEVPQLGPNESQNRFNRVFKQFIHVFTRPEHPLVLFLDDLQWADSASLKLIHLLVTDPDSQYLLLIGAYRNNEVDATHPLTLTLNEIKNAGAIINNITLGSLELGHASQLVADTLHHSICDVKNLAELVFNKTQGNPFFLTQLLQTLYHEQLLNFDFNAGCWQWDIKQIQAVGITDYNVVELIARNIQKMSLKTQNVLKLAACIGDKFSLYVLATVHEKSETETAADLWEALQAGLVLPLSDAYKIPLLLDSSMASVMGAKLLKVSYKFLHDRVQQAAYSLIPEESKKETHIKIGQLLLEHTPKEEIENNIFEIVNQFNVGIELIADQVARDELAQLNLIAGKRAKAATAYEPALRYLTVGLGLLSSNSWQYQYDLTLNIYVEAVEAEYLNTNFERAESYAEIVLQQATSILEKVKVYEIKMQIYLAQMEVKLAINTGLQVLEMLGVSLKQDPPKDLAIEELANLPIMSDPHKLTAMRILVSIIAAAYSGDPALLSHLTYTMVDLSIKYGNSPQAAYAYCLYGMILSGVMGEIDSGYQFGKLALKVLEICRATELKSKVLCIFNGCIRHWKESAQETLEFLLEGIQSGLETGDIEHAGYCSHHYCSHTLFVGKPLELVTERYSQYVELMIKLKHNFSANYLNVIYQLSLNLMGRSIDLFSLNGEALNEAEAVPVLIEKNNAATLSQFYLAKTILFYFFKKPQMALENAKNAEKYAGAGIGLILQAEQNFYYSLALLSLCLNAEREEKIKYLSQVKANQARMKLWAYNIPQNFKHKYELVEAETARVLGKIGKAMEYYERAIAGAKEQGYIHEEALSNELAAEFYFSRNQEKIATVFITEAYYGYARWGATAKVKDLEESYHEIFSKILKREPEEIEVGRTTTATTYFNSGVLDLATVMKAYQALSSEIVLRKLLEKVIQFVLENAGAQTSYLILETEGKLLIEAMGSVDQKEVTVLKSIPITTSQHLPLSVINYVARTKENIVFKNATCEGLFTSDPYITQFQPQSILCMPILHQGKLIGILYLENNLTTSAFTPERIEVLKILASQAVISIENARLYTKVSQAKEELENYNRTLEHKVEERTLELKGKNARLIQEISDRKRTEEALRQSEALLRIKAEQLELALKELQAAQTQLIQNEKMSSLGQLVAGVAHEINNPVNFIYGNLTHADEYTSDLFQLLNLYQQHYPNPGSYIHDFIEEIELEFVREDLPKLLSSMKLGADRIRQIVLSLRNFSRLDEAEMKPVDIHEGIDSTLMILQNRLKAKPDQPAIQLIKEYGNLPLVECYAGSLNQVFMNLLSNAIDVLEETIKSSLMDSSTCQVDSSKIVGNGEGTGSLLRTHDLQPTIRIRTEMVDKDRVLIRIADNGHGMTEEIRHRLFDPFYTTKPVGKGTGLGLSISYQIVVEKHGGRLHCISAPCQGAEFTIEIPIRQQY